MYFSSVPFLNELYIVSLMDGTSQLYNQSKIYCYSLDDMPMGRTVNMKKGRLPVISSMDK